MAFAGTPVSLAANTEAFAGTPASLAANAGAFAGVPQVSRQMLGRLRESRKSRGKCWGVCGYSRKSRGKCWGVCGYSRKSRGKCWGVRGSPASISKGTSAVTTLYPRHSPEIRTLILSSNSRFFQLSVGPVGSIVLHRQGLSVCKTSISKEQGLPCQAYAEAISQQGGPTNTSKSHDM